MYLPQLNILKSQSRIIEKFKGVNRNRVCEENEFFDTDGLCSGDHPALSTAPVSYKLDSFNSGKHTLPVFFHNKGVGCLAYLRSDENDEICNLYYKGRSVRDFTLSKGLSSGNIVDFNGKTLIINKYAYEFDPDFVSATDALFPMGYTLQVEAAHASPTYNERTLRLSLQYEDMTRIGKFTCGTADSDFPEDAEVNDCHRAENEWYRMIYKDNSNSSKNLWEPITSLRLRLNIGEAYRKFKAGDYVRLSDLKFWRWNVRHMAELDRFVRIDVQDDDGVFVTEPIGVIDTMEFILEATEYPTNDIIGYNKPIINNAGNDLYLLEGSISSCMPELDMVCAGANRVWGCSNSKREIYACELGNARNWSTYEGLSSDSYAVSVGSAGDFTACISYQGEQIFFKDNEMIVVSGTKPASYTLNSYSCRGVSADSPAGVCVVSDTLYYKACDGIYAYNGSFPICISEALGDEGQRLRSAVLGGEGNILFVAGRAGEQYVRYTYDTVHGIWHRLEGDRVCGYLRYPEATLEAVHEGESAFLRTLYKGIPQDYDLVGAEAQYVKWSWESSDISYGTAECKYVRRISLDFESEGPSDLYISYNGNGFEPAGHFHAKPRGTRDVYIFPKRCDHFRLRMEGKGRMTLYTLTKEIEEARENG